MVDVPYILLTKKINFIAPWRIYSSDEISINGTEMEKPRSTFSMSEGSDEHGLFILHSRQLGTTSFRAHQLACTRWFFYDLDEDEDEARKGSKVKQWKGEIPVKKLKRAN